MKPFCIIKCYSSRHGGHERRRAGHKSTLQADLADLRVEMSERIEHVETTLFKEFRK